MREIQQQATEPKPRILDKIELPSNLYRQTKRRIRKRISAPYPKTPNSFWTTDTTLGGDKVNYEYSQADCNRRGTEAIITNYQTHK